MSWELYYTSADRGLRPHSRGFCTVARSEGMPAAVVERLESLSNYQPIFPGGSPLTDRNPIAWAHWKIPVGSRNRSVLSRVAFVGSDYTGRPSKFAHHVLLEPAEQSPVGPAGMLLSDGVMKSTWEGEPKLLATRPLKGMTAADTPDASGDPAVPTRLAQLFQDDAERPIYLLYEAGADVLPLLNDAIRSLPPALRWQATFNTYFTGLPAGLSCAWRCVVSGTPAASAATSATGILIDLTVASNQAHRT